MEWMLQIEMSKHGVNGDNTQEDDNTKYFLAVQGKIKLQHSQSTVRIILPLNNSCTIKYKYYLEITVFLHFAFTFNVRPRTCCVLTLVCKAIYELGHSVLDLVEVLC